MEDENVEEVIRDFVRNHPDVIIDDYSDGGANGDLYFGTRKILGDRVALKFYYYTSNPQSHNEPQILQRIDHPNVLKVLDAKILSSYYAYFLTPQISGGDLHKYMQKNSIDFYQGLKITQGILKGLTELHKDPNNLVHRDLKPNNILIDEISKNPFISDFGSVKYIPSSSQSVVASKNTYVYKPKEAIVDNIYTRQSDIYQVGIILFQLLGGYFPVAPIEWLNGKEKKKFDLINSGDFDRWKYIESVIDRLVIKDLLINCDTLPFYISLQTKKIIRKATCSDLSKRYHTTSEFLKDIFDLFKNSKNWYKADLDLYLAHNKSGDRHFRISKLNDNYILEISKDKSQWRKNNAHDGTLKNIVEIVESLN